MGQRLSLFALVALGWTAASLLAMTYGTILNWPDYVHVDYGFPFTFATHTLNTIAGPADRWSLDPAHMLADLLFWSLGWWAILAASLYYRQRANG